VTLPVGAQIGKYIVRRKLAEGGMAEIYLATSQGAEGFEKEVVIKRVRSFLASDPSFVDMFIAEARLASRLNHANVVQIFDFEKHEDTYYLAMEYVRGCTLSDLRRKCKDLLEPMPPVLVAHIGAEVARGLHYAHRLKVNGEPLFLVHRDVTPHNVLISFDGAVKLTDFGIAKAGNKLTSPGMLKGKFAYMSPEQSRGENVDARTDVFALGIVLWEMLTGGRLFDGESELAVLRAVQQSGIPHPARISPDIPQELDAVVMKALERELEARYQTAGELERALVQCVLNHAQSPDDTDVAAFVRRVYIGGVPSVMALPAMPERTQRLEAASKPAGAREPVPHGPTAVMPGHRERRGSTAGGGEGSGLAPSPDEDVHAPTHLLPRREESAGGKETPPPRVSTPGKPLPAVQGRTATPGAPVPAAAPAHGPDHSQRPTDLALQAIQTPSHDGQDVARSEAGAEPPRYEPTVTLPTPAPAAAPAPVAASTHTGAPAPGREGSGRRIVLRAGGAMLALVVAVSVGAYFASREEAPESAPGESQGAVPAALMLSPPLADDGASPGGALPERPGTPEPAQLAQEAAGAGTAADAGALAVAPPPGASDAAPGPEGSSEASRPVLATPAVGSLVVRAKPYATVLVNGRKLGEVLGRKTFKLAPGSYQLTVEHPDGSRTTETVTIEPNGTVTREFRAR
jgi:eukaryotic-like serine/threonine-protein kinase